MRTPRTGAGAGVGETNETVKRETIPPPPIPILRPADADHSPKPPESAQAPDAWVHEQFLVVLVRWCYAGGTYAPKEPP